MKPILRRTAAVVLVVALFTPWTAVAAPQGVYRNGTERIERLIKTVKKFFGISVNDDLPLPPHPTPPPPPPPTE